VGLIEIKVNSRCLRDLDALKQTLQEKIAKNLGETL
jgi:hypothetical protein